jgi:hypothetical protein
VWEREEEAERDAEEAEEACKREEETEQDEEEAEVTSELEGEKGNAVRVWDEIADIICDTE